MHVVLAGGGSAGHIEPALNLGDALRAADPTTGVTVLGTEHGLDTLLVPRRGYELTLIPPVPLPRRPDKALLSLPLRLRAAIGAVARVLDETKADVLVGFGSYVALPAYLAARRRKVPFVVHEANPLPGLGNRVGARFTPFVAVTHPDTPLPHAVLTGVPLRPAILDLDRAAVRAEARASFGLDADRPTLLVTGGSQGARTLNETMAAAAGEFAAAGVQVLHVHGPRNTVAVELPPDSPPYVTVPFVDRMDLAYAAADLALCRSGMMTVAELSAVGLPAAYVPLPIGNGEQRRNAQPVVAAGGAMLVADDRLDPAWLRLNVLPVLADPGRLAAMSAAARGASRRDAGEALRALVLRAAGADAVGREARNAVGDEADEADETDDTTGTSGEDGRG